MNDPLGFVSNNPAFIRDLAPGTGGPARPADGPSFKAHLQQQIDQVNALQTDAREAIEDLFTGSRDDLEGVIIATEKADVAFRMLLQVRNKVMDAYEEVKQLRV
ncbi:MAG: flagellar hook-basal body complex protein FliE [Planctomycetota bacterium]|jgi:flagellar hook-basal body complex protein FliE